MHTIQPPDSDQPKPFRIVAIDGPHAIPGRPHIVLSRKNRGPAPGQRLALSESGLLEQSPAALPDSPNLKVLRLDPSETDGANTVPDGGDIIAMRRRGPPSSEAGFIRLSDEPEGAA